MRLEGEAAAPSPGLLIYPDRVEGNFCRSVGFGPVAAGVRRLGL